TQIQRGKPAHLQGTWGHPQVSINCGQWCSPKFAVLVSKWVFDWIITGQNPISSQSMGNPIDLLSGLEELEKLIISIRSQARAVHTCAHQPVDKLLAKSLHSLSHNQLSAIASAVHQMQTLKELGTMTAELPVIPEIRTIQARTTQTAQQKKQLVSVNIKLPLSQKRWLATTAQVIRQNNLQPLPPGERVYPQHLIEVAVELLQHSAVDLDSVYSIFWDLDESLAKTNFKMVRSQQEWLADVAQRIRNNCSVPTLPAERVYPQHLIGVAIDLLQNVDVNWSEVKNVEELKEHINL
ncbi:MAG: KilA-N domain-containing protein, partial [Waterburya sp.]